MGRINEIHCVKSYSKLRGQIIIKKRRNNRKRVKELWVSLETADTREEQPAVACPSTRRRDSTRWEDLKLLPSSPLSPPLSLRKEESEPSESEVDILSSELSDSTKATSLGAQKTSPRRYFEREIN